MSLKTVLTITGLKKRGGMVNDKNHTESLIALFGRFRWCGLVEGSMLPVWALKFQSLVPFPVHSFYFLVVVQDMSPGFT